MEIRRKVWNWEETSKQYCPEQYCKYNEVHQKFLVSLDPLLSALPEIYYLVFSLWKAISSKSKLYYILSGHYWTPETLFLKASLVKPDLLPRKKLGANYLEKDCYFHTVFVATLLRGSDLRQETKANLIWDIRCVDFSTLLARFQSQHCLPSYPLKFRQLVPFSFFLQVLQSDVEHPRMSLISKHQDRQLGNKFFWWLKDGGKNSHFQNSEALAVNNW